MDYLSIFQLVIVRDLTTKSRGHHHNSHLTIYYHAHVVRGGTYLLPPVVLSIDQFLTLKSIGDDG